MKKQIVFFILSFCLINNEMPASNSPYQNKEYYWFYIKLGKKLDKETGTTRMYVKKIGNQIETGSYNEFIKRNKLGLKVGKIVLGPFDEKSQAQKSQSFYKYAGTEKKIPEKELVSIKSDTIYSFYYTRPLAGNWVQALKFMRIPARIANGTLNEFVALLNEGLYYEKLAIGPFLDYELAEKSKFIFRKNGEMDFESKDDSIKSLDIEDMAKKWKSLKIEIVKQTNKKKTNQALYQLKIKFPRKYFVENAFQTITIKAKYSDPLLVSNSGLTLQGSYAMDNNPVISFEKGATFTQTLSFNKYKAAKIKGFLFESFIFNNIEMIEQGPVNIKVK